MSPYLENNRFQKNSIMQNTNTWIWVPPYYRSFLATENVIFIFKSFDNVNILKIMPLSLINKIAGYRHLYWKKLLGFNSLISYPSSISSYYFKHILKVSIELPFSMSPLCVHDAWNFRLWTQNTESYNLWCIIKLWWNYSI